MIVATAFLCYMQKALQQGLMGKKKHNKRHREMEKRKIKCTGGLGKDSVRQTNLISCFGFLERRNL